MDNCIGLLLLVVPGFVVYSVGKHVGGETETKSDFEITIHSLVYIMKEQQYEAKYGFTP